MDMSPMIHKPIMIIRMNQNTLLIRKMRMAVTESCDAVAGDVIYTKEIDTRSLPKSGTVGLLNFSQFEDRLPDFKGIYHVMIRSTKDYWVRDSRFISFSDIGLIAQSGPG